MPEEAKKEILIKLKVDTTELDKLKGRVEKQAKGATQQLGKTQKEITKTTGKAQKETETQLRWIGRDMMRISMFISSMQKVFSEAWNRMVSQSLTLGAAIEDIRWIFDEIAAVIGDALSPIFDTLAVALEPVLRFFEEHEEVARMVGLFVLLGTVSFLLVGTLFMLTGMVMILTYGIKILAVEMWGLSKEITLMQTILFILNKYVKGIISLIWSFLALPFRIILGLITGLFKGLGAALLGAGKGAVGLLGGLKLIFKQLGITQKRMLALSKTLLKGVAGLGFMVIMWGAIGPIFEALQPILEAVGYIFEEIFYHFAPYIEKIADILLTLGVEIGKLVGWLFKLPGPFLLFVGILLLGGPLISMFVGLLARMGIDLRLIAANFKTAAKSGKFFNLALSRLKRTVPKMIGMTGALYGGMSLLTEELSTLGKVTTVAGIGLVGAGAAMALLGTAAGPLAPILMTIGGVLSIVGSMFKETKGVSKKVITVLEGMGYEGAELYDTAEIITSTFDSTKEAFKDTGLVGEAFRDRMEEMGFSFDETILLMDALGEEVLLAESYFEDFSSIIDSLAGKIGVTSQEIEDAFRRWGIDTPEEIRVVMRTVTDDVAAILKDCEAPIQGLATVTWEAFKEMDQAGYDFELRIGLLYSDMIGFRNTYGRIYGDLLDITRINVPLLIDEYDKWIKEGIDPVIAALNELIRLTEELKRAPPSVPVLRPIPGPPPTPEVGPIPWYEFERPYGFERKGGLITGEGLGYLHPGDIVISPYEREGLVESPVNVTIESASIRSEEDIYSLADEISRLQAERARRRGVFT